jgi:hypothetical protein
MMKTSKIITSIVTLNLILFMSVTSMANTVTINTGEIRKSGAVAEFTSASVEYLRFDLNNYIGVESEISELPAESDFDYLRFGVNNFTLESTTDLTEMPVNEFDYLRFDVSEYTNSTEGEIDEMPVM